MPTCERSVRVSAPFERVWDFHRRVSGLERLTPNWLSLRIESVSGPDGEPASDALEAGTTVRLSVAPFGLRIGWTSQIVALERREGAAFFRDVMEDGPFPEWTHDHLFYRDGDATLVRDRVAFELPPGGLGRRLGPLGLVGLAPMFHHRHRRTKQLLERP